MAKKKAKKKVRAKKETKSDPKETAQPSVQVDLIDVRPKASKKIVQVARAYKTAQASRINALQEEVEHKNELIDLIAQENLQPLADGSIKFTVDGYTISVKPRDALVQVKCLNDDSE